MNIEFRFLQKAIEDRNFVSFYYDGKSYKRVKPISILDGVLKCDVGEFDIKGLKKITVLKERF